MREDVTTRRTVLQLMGASGAGLALSGCVGDAGGSGAPSPAGESAADVAGASGDVTYWNSFTGEDERAGFQTVLDSFADEYPDITLQSQAIPNADFMTNYTTAVQSGSGPDSVMVLMERSGDMSAMGGLMDLSDYVDNWDGAADLDPKLLQPHTRDGQLLGLPMMNFVNWGYYRADWFEEAGITDPPGTWEEFREAAIAVTDPARGRYGFGMRGGAGGGTQILMLLYSYNGPFSTEDGQASLDLDATVEALRFYTGLYTVDKAVPPSAPNDSYNQIFQSFLNGGTGMIIHHTGSLQSVQNALVPMEQVRSFVLPENNYESTWLLPGANGIMANSDNPDAAFAWASHWASPGPQLDFLKATGYWPAAQSASEDPFISDNPMYDAATEAVAIGSTPTFFPGFQAWMDTVVLLETQNVLVGRSTPEDAARVIVDELEAITVANARAGG